MPLTISMRFLAGRYHATPWDKHPNEGGTEWPPSPWRLLRAVVSAAYAVDGSPDRALLAETVGALSMAPDYHLPASTSAHTRSYQPLFAAGDTSLVLDAFVAVGGGACDDTAVVHAVWPNAHLGAQASTALARWLGGLAYLGRAESWVEAWLGDVPAGGPSASIDAGFSGEETARLLAAGEVQGDALLAALMRTTASLQKSRLLEPPDSRWVTYRIRGVEANRRSVRDAVSPSERTTIVRLAVGGTVTPRLTRAVHVGDVVRCALMSKSEKLTGQVDSIFSGKEIDGTPLRGNGHLHVLPQDDDRDGHLDHILLWAPDGFSPGALGAIAELRRLWGVDDYPLETAIAGSGTTTSDPASLGVPRASQSRFPLTPARRWKSRTPFVLTRHAKVRGGRLVDGPIDQLKRELARLGLPEPLISPLGHTMADKEIPWRHFSMNRLSGGGSRGGGAGYGFVLEFPEPVRGPIAVGYGARQGLGQFEPA
ncbi:MAG: type I-U CRISPR-associated protein Cas5/Cas6 [Gemmatimonadaceae bacterium]|nr:type I-U CRISPR-associated protein Cas5/Cas6 [Gemmatimonadaceae bacterium]